MNREKFKALAEQVKQIPILIAMVTLDPPLEIFPRKDSKVPLTEEDIRAYYEGENPSKRIPNNLHARNPFRNDHNLGSFIIDRRKNTFTDHNWDVRNCSHSVVDFEQRFFRFWKEEWDIFPISEVVSMARQGKTAKERANFVKSIDPKSSLATEKGMEEFDRMRTNAYKNAVFSLAYRFNLISEEEYKREATMKPDNSPRVFSDYNPIKSEKKSSKSRPQPTIAPPIVVHLALTYLCKVRHELLTKEQLHELHHNRHVYEDEDYFSYPRRGEGRETAIAVERLFLDDIAEKSFHRSFSKLTMEQKMEIKEMKLVKLFEQQVENVPGFYRDGSGLLVVNERPNGGIGILYHDDKGRANGVQIRKAEQDPGAKYSWMSAAWTLDYPAYKGGASSGTPCGILWPRGDKIKGNICITEGRFKAEKIADAGNIAIYVSGVSTWENGGVIEMIERIRGERDSVYIMFDADLMSNPSVHGNLSNLARAIERAGQTPLMIVWSKERGKGFDDLVKNNGTMRYRSYLKTIKFEVFEEVYDYCLNITKKKYGIQDPRFLEKNQVDSFSTDMQHSLEKVLRLKK